MKIRVLLFAVASAFVVGPAVAADDKPETELGAKMEKMSGAFRALRRQITDASKNEDSLAKLATIRQNAEASVKLDPAKKSEIPAADQKKFVADYQAKMKEFIALVGKVEAALKANNNEEAGKLLTAMGDAQKQGHKQFKKDDKKKG
jgi:cytochrome c556